jgi:hypothetical protein
MSCILARNAIHNGAIIYGCIEFEDYLGNVGSKELFTGDGVKGLQIPQP